MAAARILDQKKDRDERARNIGEAIASGKLGVDVLAQPLSRINAKGWPTSCVLVVPSSRTTWGSARRCRRSLPVRCFAVAARRSGILLACRASLKAQWAGEIARYAGAQAVVIVGGADARRAAFASDAPYVVLNYELTWRDLAPRRTSRPTSSCSTRRSGRRTSARRRRRR